MTSMFLDSRDLQADEGAEGDEVVDEDVGDPGLPVATTSFKLHRLSPTWSLPPSSPSP